VRLRFATIVGQLITIVAVRFGMDLPIPLASTGGTLLRTGKKHEILFNSPSVSA